MEQTYVPAPSKPGYGMALASLIVGAAGLLMTCCYGLSLPIGVAAIVLGIVAMKAAKRAEVVD